MQFNVREWRRCYDAVARMGKVLKDSYPSKDENGKTVLPVAPLSIEMQKKIEIGINRHLKKSSVILDAAGLKPHTPLWIYDADDPKTWASHYSFIYDHLYREKYVL